MHARDLDVTVTYLLRLCAKCHLIELPCLTEDVQCTLIVLLTQVNLSNHLQDLTIWRMGLTKDLFVHFKRLLQQWECIFKVSRLHVTTVFVQKGHTNQISNAKRRAAKVCTYFPRRVRMCEWYCLVTSILEKRLPFSFSAVVRWSSACSKYLFFR